MSKSPSSQSFNYDYADGSQLWLRYLPVSDASLMEAYREAISGVIVQNCGANKSFRANPDLAISPGSKEKIVDSTLEAVRDELLRGLGGMLDKAIPEYTDGLKAGAVVAGTPDSSPVIAELKLDADLANVGAEGYVIKSVKASGFDVTVIAGNTDIGVLYGTFTFLRLIQTQKPVTNLNIADKPKFNNRQLNNWEMGTRGPFSVGTFLKWKGENALPAIIDSYIVFERSQNRASIGFGGRVSSLRRKSPACHQLYRSGKRKRNTRPVHESYHACPNHHRPERGSPEQRPVF